MIFTDEMIEHASDRAYAHVPRAGGLVSPFRPGQVNPASYDVTLHPVLRVPVPGSSTREPLDLAGVTEEYLEEWVVEDHGRYLMEPGEFILASTIEYLRIPDTIAARVEGKSSLARVGLIVHATGGFIDPGFEGQVTLEMVNLLHRPLMIYPGMPIAQIAFQGVAGAVKRPYGLTGRYQGQTGPTLSRYACGPVSAPVYSCSCWRGTYEDLRRETDESSWCEPCGRNRMVCPDDHCLECGAST